METKPKSDFCPGFHSFGRAFCAGAALALAVSAQAQNLFVSSYGPGGGITEITPTGVQSTFASGLDDPFGLAFDRAGNLFVTILGGVPQSGSVIKITPGGVQSVFASGLPDPVALAFNQAGDLFVADTRGSIFEFTAGGLESTFASGLAQPRALAFNSAGDLFVATAPRTFPPPPGSGGAILEFTPGGVQSTFASGPPGPVGLAFNSTGDLFVAATSGNIYEYTSDGARSTFASFSQVPQTLRQSPVGLAFNGADDLFVTLSQSPLGSLGDVYEFTPDGTQSTFATGLAHPLGLAFQPVPEPPVWAMLGPGTFALLVSRRCRRCVKR